MLARQLDYSPAADELPLVIEVMYEDLVRAGFGDQDAERIVVAFDRIAITGIKWPTAFAVKEAAPKLSEGFYPRLPYNRSAMERQKGLDALKNIKARLAK